MRSLMPLLILTACTPAQVPVKASCLPNPVPVAEGPPPLVARLMVFGDSFFTSDIPVQVARRLSFDLRNQALGGSKFTDQVQCQSIVNQRYYPNDRVLLTVGYVDRFLDKTDPSHLGQFTQDLRTSVAYLASSPAQVYISSLTFMLPESEARWNVPREATLMYLAAIERVKGEATYPNIHWIPTDQLFTPAGNILPDGLHPNAAGEQKLVDIFVGAIK